MEKKLKNRFILKIIDEEIGYPKDKQILESNRKESFYLS